jgi:glycosyltransferase involved in cell wall biosynthesis
VASFSKISTLVLFSSSDIGGAERSLSRMSLSNNNDSISYTLSTFGADGELSKWVDSSGGKLICFNNSLWKLVKFIRIEKPDVIYIIGFRLSVILRIILPILSKSFLIQGVRWNPASKSNLDKFFRFTERIFGSLLDGYIVNSDSARKSLEELKIKNITLIYNGIEDYKISNISKDRNKNVLTIANFSYRKGYEEYINIIASIVKRVPESQFIFLGKDNLNGKIQRLIFKNNLENNIQCLGFREDVEKFLEKSAIFVLPSLYGEGCPTSILEAFSFSLPVVAYQIDGIPELVTNGVDGILLDVGDENEFAEAIITLLLDPKKSIKMGVAGHKKVKDSFLLEEMVNKHNEYFLGLK